MDTPTLHISLARTPDAPSLARAAITGFADGRDVDASRLATLTLLVSEVVTNAVIHSDAPPGSEVIVCARWVEGGAVRVEVTDRGGGFARAPRAAARPGGGYGLSIVEQAARRWGVDRSGGTCVWFELVGVHRGAGPRPGTHG